MAEGNEAIFKQALKQKAIPTNRNGPLSKYYNLMIRTQDSELKYQVEDQSDLEESGSTRFYLR